jgi:hypothetical protein
VGQQCNNSISTSRVGERLRFGDGEVKSGAAGSSTGGAGGDGARDGDGDGDSDGDNGTGAGMTALDGEGLDCIATDKDEEEGANALLADTVEGAGMARVRGVRQGWGGDGGGGGVRVVWGGDAGGG